MATRNRGLTLTTTETLITETCCACGVLFAMAQDFQERRQEDGQSFYCPAGHGQHYAETDIDRLKRDVSRLQDANRRLERDRAFLREQSDELLDNLGAKTKEIKSLKARAKAGVCIECHRHFANVERHYKSRHPSKE